MAFIAVAIIAAGAISAYSAIEAGKQAERDAKAQQILANRNAEIAEQKAKAELERAREEAEQFREEGEALQATQKVGYAKGGVLASIETPAEVIDKTERELDEDRLKILQEGYNAESFALSQAENLKYEGRIAKARGAAAKRGSYYQAAGSILSAIGGAAYASSSGGGGGNKPPASFNPNIKGGYK